MIQLHFVAQKRFADFIFVYALFEQAKKELFLVSVRVLLVVAQKRILAKQLAPCAHYPGCGREQAKSLRRAPVGWQAGFPGLGFAPCRVQQLCVEGEFVKVIPLGFKEPDGLLVFFLETDPGLIVLSKIKHRFEFLFGVPVGEPGTLQQHDTAGHAFIDQALGARPHATQYGLVFHVAAEQFPNVSSGEDIRVNYDGPALKTHQFWWHKPGGCERL